jgi:hydrogenase maturation protease
MRAGRWWMNCGPHDGVLVIGYGNPLRSDDAVGLHVARAARAAGFEAVEIFQLVPELAERIAAARVVLFVDCDVRLAPGEVAVSGLPHPVGFVLHDPASPAGLVELARTLYGRAPEARCIGIGPESLEMGEELSPVVGGVVMEAVRLCGVEPERVGE